MDKQTKMLFLDLDGTLLNDAKEITDGNRAAIEAALKAGHKIVLSTGRATSSALQLAKRLALTSEGCYAITFNGGCIYDLHSEKAVFRTRLSIAEIRRILDLANSFGIYAQTYSETGILAERDAPELHRYAETTNMEYEITDRLYSLIPNGAEKVIVIDFGDHRHLEDFRQELRTNPPAKIDTFFSSMEYLEVVPQGINKGSAIRRFCQHMGIPIERTVSAGDAQNDISMLQTTQIGAVMKNAPDYMRQYGNYLTEHDNNHDGIAEIIEKFIL